MSKMNMEMNLLVSPKVLVQTSALPSVEIFINDKEFRMEYYYPYLHGSQITTCETIEIERHAAREAFAGICDELKLGVTLIFYIENIADILHARKNCRTQYNYKTR